jgi:hypothetical protein
MKDSDESVEGETGDVKCGSGDIRKEVVQLNKQRLSLEQ